MGNIGTNRNDASTFIAAANGTSRVRVKIAKEVMEVLNPKAPVVGKGIFQAGTCHRTVERRFCRELRAIGSGHSERRPCPTPTSRSISQQVRGKEEAEPSAKRRQPTTLAVDVADEPRISD